MLNNRIGNHKGKISFVHTGIFGKGELPMYFYCEKCKKQYPLNTHAIRCSCGGLFRLHKDAEDIVPRDIYIGGGETPMVRVVENGIELLLKLENLQPTGSYKDRGADALINVAHSLGIERVALDSAGYAGASVAAYAAAAGIKCRVFVPEKLSAAATKQMEMYGAEIVRVPGGRMDTCAAVKQHLGSAYYYASPVYNPLFAEGVKSLAWEIYHQLADKVPEYIFVPAGNGSLLLGLYYGFMEIGRLPHLVAVQSAACAPLYDAFYAEQGAAAGHTGSHVESLEIEQPKRLDEMLFAIQSSGGDVVKVTQQELEAAQKRLGSHGVYAEISAAAGFAAATHFFAKGKPDNYRVVVPVTGSGFKH
jgi:threonine synthase